MSSRDYKNSQTIGDRVIELERQVEKLQRLVNACWRTNGYVLINTGSGLVIRNTATNVDTPIAP